MGITYLNKMYCGCLLGFYEKVLHLTVGIAIASKRKKQNNHFPVFKICITWYVKMPDDSSLKTDNMIMTLLDSVIKFSVFS